ncbi:MAG: DUF4157 domain-containing protein [Myxococcales bacterium]|nr:DUF4157 domain-containing protein [Myxococcales bacterium]
MTFELAALALALAQEDEPRLGATRPNVAPGKRTLTQRFAGASAPVAQPAGTSVAPSASPTIDHAAPFALHLTPETDAVELGDEADEVEADREADAIVSRLRPAARAGGSFDDHRARFERAMGVGLAHVQVRCDDERNHALGALAHARGSVLSFAPRAFAPGTPAGDRLIAHELAHTRQSAGPLRRKVAVAGHAWDDAEIEQFLQRLHRKYPDLSEDPLRAQKRLRRPNPRMQLTLRRMGAQDQVFTFRSVVELERMLVMRERSVASLDQPASCQYPDEDAHPRLSPSHWERAGHGSFSWRVKKGVQPSAAIHSIFDGSEGEWRLECFTMTAGAVYKGQLDALGDEQFDRHYPAGLTLSTNKREGGGVPGLVRAGVLEQVKVDSVYDLLPGDWVYFKNHPGYRAKHPGGYMQGINTICLGRTEGADTQFRGFGIPDSTAHEIRVELAAAYNARPKDRDERDGASIDDKVMPDEIPGPLLDRVRRPARAALETR